jgi:hypothetical protein
MNADFDRIAARDYSPFEKLPRKQYEQLTAIDRLTEVPIVIDKKLNKNTLELRNGDEVVKRIFLA